MRRAFPGVLLLGCIVLGGTAMAGERVLRTVFQENAPPRYFEEKHYYTGICVDFIEGLNRHLAPRGLRIEAEEVASLTRVFGLLRTDGIELFVGMGRTPEREKEFAFSREWLLDIEYVFAKRSGDRFEFSGEDSLRGKRVGTLKGVWNEDVLRKMPGVEVDGVRHMALNMQKLLSGRLDLVSYHNLGLLWEIHRSGLDGDIVFAKNPLRKDLQYIIYRRDMDEATINVIDDALRRMKANGELQRILDAYLK